MRTGPSGTASKLAWPASSLSAAHGVSLTYTSARIEACRWHPSSTAPGCSNRASAPPVIAHNPRMRAALLRPFLALLLCACAGLGPEAAAAGTLCATTARRPPADARIGRAVDEARRQHRLFGGQTIERNGGLFRAGWHEAEWSRAPGESTPTWERVAGFWRALSPSEPTTLVTSAGRMTRSQAWPAPPAGTPEGARSGQAVDEALLRAAIVDTPWSAAFVSYLMKTAGFLPAEFAFSDTHADYVGAAFEASAAEAAGRDTGYAFRACDPARTRPRAGDLLCATRAGTAGITRFGALAAALAERSPGQPFPMHCDLVVRSDQGGDAKLEAIGGNVVQSVTLSRMTLNASKVLSAAYVAGAAPRADCAGDGPRCRGSLSRRPWVVLLQFRQ